MTPLQEKLQSIQDQGFKKILQLFHIMCPETDRLKEKLLGSREEKMEAREELTTFLRLLKEEFAKLHEQTGKTTDEILSQVSVSNEFTEKEKEEILNINTLLEYCTEISMKKPTHKTKTIKKIKG